MNTTNLECIKKSCSQKEVQEKSLPCKKNIASANLAEQYIRTRA